MADSTETRICHYTSIKALIGILQWDGIILRATNVLYMNDTREVDAGLKVIRDIAQEKTRPGITNEMKTALGKKIRIVGSDLFEDFYVTSFCNFTDNLEMWRMYADNGKGCVLEFDRTMICKEFENKAHRLFLQCVYGDEAAKQTYGQKIKDQIDEIVNAYNDRNRKKTEEKYNKFLNDFACYCLSTKDDVYKGENECRGVYHSYEKDERGKCILKEIYKTKAKVNFREKNNYLVPYVEIGLPKEALKRVVVGPSVDDFSKQSVKRFLEIRGYGGVDFCKSKMPYRG